MTVQMDLARLRNLIEGVLADLYQQHRHEGLPALCERLRLPPPPSQEDHTKHQRLTASLQTCPDTGLEAVAQAILDSRPLAAGGAQPAAGRAAGSTASGEDSWPCAA